MSSEITSPHPPALQGTIVPLRTKAECRASTDLVDVYIVEIPLKSSSHFLKVIKDGIPGSDKLPLQHLRRLAKKDVLPEYLKLTSIGAQSRPASSGSGVVSPSGRLSSRPTSSGSGKVPTEPSQGSPESFGIEGLNVADSPRGSLATDAPSAGLVMGSSSQPTSPVEIAVGSAASSVAGSPPSSPFHLEYPFRPRVSRPGSSSSSRPGSSGSLSPPSGQSRSPEPPSSRRPKSRRSSRSGSSRGQKTATIHLLICPTSYISLQDLRSLLLPHLPTINDRLQIIPVPALAATSAEQARHWSENFWPTIYNRSNPFGPHPNNLNKFHEELEPHAGQWLALAVQAGKEAADCGAGEPIGAVVLQEGEPVAVAGDMRWAGREKDQTSGSGNVMAHAALRAIGMIAKKRIRIDRDEKNFKQVWVERDAEDRDRPDWFHDSPKTSLEQHYFDATEMEPSGYLCTALDMVLTHEPCIMCSMAILHSRFKTCIFGERMPLTGGLTADSFVDRGVVYGTAGDAGGLQYGLFWRPELNWKFVAWEWQADEGDSHIPQLDDAVNA